MSHILIVEDEPVIRGALRKLLERHDHSVAEADSVEQARENGLTQCDLINTKKSTIFTPSPFTKKVPKWCA